MRNGAQLSTRTMLTDRAELPQLLAVHVLAGRLSWQLLSVDMADRTNDVGVTTTDTTSAGSYAQNCVMEAIGGSTCAPLLL